MRIQIAGLVNDSIVDGTGMRYTIFTQGCPHHCAGCHNPQTHDFDGGKSIETDEIVEKFRKNPLLDGITLSGGEPFCQSAACLELAKAAHAAGLNVWIYSGYTYETLLNGENSWKYLLDEADVLVDGPFLQEKRTLDCRFRGSSNQRLIDLHLSKKEGRLIEIE